MKVLNTWMSPTFGLESACNQNINILKMEAAELILILAPLMSMPSRKWPHCLHILGFWYCRSVSNVRFIYIDENRNIPVLADIVEHATYMYNFADLCNGAYSDLAMYDMEAAFELSDSSFHDAPCQFVGP